MRAQHVPRIDRRYWSGITFASIFGTNLGDFYAHESGLGLGLGLLLLIGMFAAVYWVGAKDERPREVYYWLAIIIIRTGATNIADYLAFRVRVPALLLVSGLAGLIAVFGWRASSSRGPALATTNLPYWTAMLAAGVFGTVLGDICSHRFGQGAAAGLASILVVLLSVAGSRAATSITVYWCAVAVARTAGTCMGDWLAETKALHIGLTLSTLLTGRRLRRS